MEGLNQEPVNQGVNEEVINTSNVINESGNVDNSTEQVIQDSQNESTENLRNDLINKPIDKSFIPEEYREKGWTKNINSIDDLYKAYDNAQGLIGKKTIGIPSDDASPEELKTSMQKQHLKNITLKD